ncbi:transposase [Paenibacillus athensensis]|nr:transposase [Paenibacillus athensensis]
METSLLQRIVAELGDVKQFVAYAGLDPGVFSSGEV